MINRTEFNVQNNSYTLKKIQGSEEILCNNI
jgi:hypothetical protein